MLTGQAITGRVGVSWASVDLSHSAGSACMALYSKKRRLIVRPSDNGAAALCVLFCLYSIQE